MEMKLTNQELRRYDRQISLPEIGESGQLKIKATKAMVVGAGGLGCAVLQYLTVAGIGALDIIDNGIVSETNLYRQVLYGAGDLGKMKTIIARERLRELNPLVNIDIHNLRLTKENVVKLFSNCDIIIDSSCDLTTSYLINDACVMLNKIMFYGAVSNFQGITGVFNYPGMATFRCAFPVPEKHPFFHDLSYSGNIALTPGIIGTYQANEVIKLIVGNGIIFSGQLLSIDLINNVFTVAPIELDPQNLNLSSFENAH
jgi:sulfur-carrier protein adenylyltransferase/sulfurtransferase